MKQSSAVRLVLLTAAACLWLAAQPPRRLPGTIRVRVTEVPVDVIVLDKENRPVLDLKKEDFLVFEEGTPQQIVHFLLQSYVDGEPPRGGEPKPAGEPVPGAVAESVFGNPHYRTFLLVIGQGRHRNFKAIPRVMDFFRSGLKPTDRVALMAFNRATDFTTEHDKFLAVLESYQKISPLIESKVELRKRGLAAIYGDPNILSRYQKAIDEIFRSEGIQSRRISSVDIRDRRERAAQDRRLMESKEQLDMDKVAAEHGVEAEGTRPNRLSETIETELALDGMEFDEYVTLRTDGLMDSEKLQAAIEYMRYLDGEKHIIFLNDQGLALARLEHDQGIASKANDARVRIHCIQTGGVYVGERSAFSAANQGGFSGVGAPGLGPMSRPFPGTICYAFALHSVRNLAHLTGGQAFSHADIAKCLEKIEQATAVSYLLGYVPTNKTLDGRFRRIEVRVRRPGVRVQYRRGYYAERTLKPYDRKQFLTHSRTSAVAGLEELIHDVDFSIETAKMSHGGPDLFRSILTIRPAPNIYTLKDDRYVGQMAITYFLFDRSGRLLRETWDDLDMALRPETHDRVMKDGFPLERDHPLPAGVKEALLRVVVYDIANDRAGSAEAKLKAQR